MNKYAVEMSQENTERFTIVVRAASKDEARMQAMMDVACMPERAGTNCFIKEIAEIL